MISTTEGFTDNGPRSSMKPTLDKKPSARKSLCLFTNILDVKNKTSGCRVRDAKSNHKPIKARNTPWVLKPKRKGNSKINNQINKPLYNWIMH